MSDFDQEMQAGFLEEAKELLTNAERCFLNLEKSSDDPAVIEEIFRLAHNLKGSAGAVGFTELAEFAHHLESFLLKVKNKQIAIDSNVVSLLLTCNDHLSAMIEGLRSDPAGSFVNQDLIARIEKYLAEDACAQSEATARPGEDESATAELGARLESLTRESLQTPAPGADRDQPGGAVGGASSAPKAPPAADESIRVSLSRIDRLMNNVGELVILQTVMSQQKEELCTALQQHTVAQMEKIIREVQEISMSLRMVPLKQTFQKMQRIVRDASQALGKEVEFSVEGEDTELDKTVLEQLGDPLVHMVRNAVDHGIETPEERESKGKHRTGRILLSARHRGSHIVIEVTDDGRGLDAKKLVAKAIEKRILPASATLSDEEAHRLIFAPGFSTKTEVTDISGRGVGMDVVRKNIEQLQGSVTIETELSKGSCMRILLPLTLAIVDGMVIRMGDERYVIPIAQIHQSLQPRRQDISYVTEKGEILNLRGESLALHRLDRVLGMKKDKGERASAWDCIALVSHSQSHGAFAILADDILGQQQVVIKRLGDEIQGIPGVSGAAILSDGKAALILDLHELIQSRVGTRSATGGGAPAQPQKEAV